MHSKKLNSMTDLTVNRLVRCHCNLQLQSAFEDFDYDVLPWDIEIWSLQSRTLLSMTTLLSLTLTLLPCGICKVQTTLKTCLRNNRAQLGDSGDSQHASVMMQAPGLGLNLLSYRPTGLLDN